MGKITLYYAIVSQPSRSVLLVGKALGLEFDLKSVNLFNREHLTPEFVKVLHCAMIKKTFSIVNTAITLPVEPTTHDPNDKR